MEQTRCRTLWRAAFAVGAVPTRAVAKPEATEVAAERPTIVGDRSVSGLRDDATSCQASSLVPTGRRSDLDRGCGERSYRVRHGRAEDLERLSQDGKQGKKIGGRKGRPGVKVAGVPERPAKGFPGRQEQVHGQDGQTEPGRGQQPEEQEEAIMELQLILSKPKEMLKRKESEEDQVALEELREAVDPARDTTREWTCLTGGQRGQEDELNNEDKTLEEHRRQSQVPSTPTGRGTKYVAMTPPAPASSWGPRRRRRRRDTTTTKARSRSATLHELSFDGCPQQPAAQTALGPKARKPHTEVSGGLAAARGEAASGDCQGNGCGHDLGLRREGRCGSKNVEEPSPPMAWR